ncbi:NAD(P)-dependent oxidoreductase, partial [Staphylococcus sp. SIMBA_130]
MVGGDKTTYGFALPYLETIGKNIFHVGEDHGLGTIVKLINNLMAGIHTQAVAEALSIADA